MPDTSAFRTRAASTLGCAVLFGAALAVLGWSGPLAARPDDGTSIGQLTVAVDYMVLNQQLPDFVDMLARDTGTRIEMTQKVRGDLVRQRIRGSLDAVLDQLAVDHDLDWFAFNGSYHLSNRSETATRLVRLGAIPAPVARAALAEAGLLTDRFPLREAANGTVVILSGPPRLLGLSEGLIESLAPPATAQAPFAPAAAVIRVRRGVQSTFEPIPTVPPIPLVSS